MKLFSPRDMVSHWDVLEVRARPTSLAAWFLDGLLERMPFPVAALQVEGGSEFTAEFVQACQQRALPLFAILLARPNSTVHLERAQRTRLGFVSHRLSQRKGLECH